MVSKYPGINTDDLITGLAKAPETNIEVLTPGLVKATETNTEVLTTGLAKVPETNTEVLTLVKAPENNPEVLTTGLILTPGPNTAVLTTGLVKIPETNKAGFNKTGTNTEVLTTTQGTFFSGWGRSGKLYYMYFYLILHFVPLIDLFILLITSSRQHISYT